MPKPWERSEEQEEYLNALLPKLVQARKDRRVERFKIDLYQGWFTRWPEELLVFGNGWKDGDPMSLEDKQLLNLALKRRQDQLYNYVRWHGGGKVVRSQTSGVLKKFLNKKTGKSSRKNQKLELYSQRYYETRFKDQVDREISETTPPNEDKKEYRKRKMAIYRKRRSLAWKMETDEVKAEIEALWNDMNNATDGVSDDDFVAEGELDPDNLKTVTEHRGYGGNIDEMGNLLTAILRQLQDETGWAFTIIGGGLNCKGEVKLVTSHVGQTAAGNAFPHVCNNYQDNVLKEFLAFVNILHPIEERLLGAQPNNEQMLRMPSPDEVSQVSTVADKSCETADQLDQRTAVDASKGYPMKDHVRHEGWCNSTNVDIASNAMASNTMVSSSLSSPMSLSTPVNVNMANAASMDTAVPSQVYAVPDLFPSSNFQSMSVSFPPPSATSTLWSTSTATESSWMSSHGSFPSFSTQVMEATPLPYESLSPMSRFLVMTASNSDKVVYSNITSTDSQLSTDLPSPILFNSTNINDPATTMVSSQISESLPNEPENKAPGTNVKKGNNNQAPVKPRKRSRKDEVDITYMLPEGTTRAHKPRQMADETCWEGMPALTRKRLRTQKTAE